MNFIVDVVEQFACELWCMILGSDCRLLTGQRQVQPSMETALPIREMTALFWPSGVGEEQACHDTIDAVMMTILAEIIFRSIFAYREQPYSSCGVRGSVISDGQISCAFGDARHVPCCVTNVKPLSDFALAPTAGQNRSRHFALGTANGICGEPSNIPREKLHADQKIKS